MLYGATRPPDARCRAYRLWWRKRSIWKKKKKMWEGLGFRVRNHSTANVPHYWQEGQTSKCRR